MYYGIVDRGCVDERATTNSTWTIVDKYPGAQILGKGGGVWQVVLG